MNKKQYKLGWNYRLNIKNKENHSDVSQYHHDFIKGMKDCNDEIIKRIITGKKIIYPDKL